VSRRGERRVAGGAHFARPIKITSREEKEKNYQLVQTMSELGDQTVELVPNLTRTDEDIKGAVTEWLRDPAAAEARYSHISLWDTSAVTNMSSLFSSLRFGNGNIRNFNEDLSAWITTNVTDLSFMFYEARSFDCDISAWDTSSVTSLSFTFIGATSFNCAIGGWHTASVTDMSFMFRGATSFQGDINEWDITSVREPVEDDDPGGMHMMFADGCPVDFTAVWEEHKADPAWQDIWRQ
jgi:surface protein